MKERAISTNMLTLTKFSSGGGGGGGGGKCCASAATRHYRPTYTRMETFDDGTPLSFYRQQVAKMYGSGGGGGKMRYGGGGGGGGGGGYGGRGGRAMGGGGRNHYKPMVGQLYKNSFGYQNMLMGGGFMKMDNGFGPAGMHTSKKWRGFGRNLVSKKGGGGYQSDGEKLTNVHVVASGATDEYKDSYLTMIADTNKRRQY
ncbi:hypothetical protein RDWZM_001348 [Blomia tropicalis]|uniref:Uncharacterized protein n=1 Tax=Blomia tropicalis TaxID=40697 RepID=A0A9Q0RNV5_BLOTA|nr:hypothetical protein RDWZM_001348 [Blomia tropicalis]